MCNNKNDSYSRDIMDRLEINYELVEKVIMDIKRQSIDNPLKNKESGDWYYYCYEELTNKELRHISGDWYYYCYEELTNKELRHIKRVLKQRYNIRVINSWLSYDLFNTPHVSLKLHMRS